MSLFYRALIIFLGLLRFLILVRVLISLLDINSLRPISRLVYEITEPILALGRDILSFFGVETEVLDFSPVIAILIINLAERTLRRLFF